MPSRRHVLELVVAGLALPARGQEEGRFMQRAAGAVERSLASKGRDVVNAADFGARGDNGITDNTGAIKAAAAYLFGEFGGGVIELNEGYFGMREAELPSGVFLRAKSPLSSKLLFLPSGDDAADAQRYVIRLNGDRPALINVGVTGRPRGAPLSKVAIGNGVRVTGVGFLPMIDNVLVDFFAGYNPASRGAGGYGVRQKFSREDMTDDAGNYLLIGGNGWVTDTSSANSHYDIRRLEIMFCDNRGFSAGIVNDSDMRIFVGFCGNLGYDGRGTAAAVPSNNRISGKVYLCNVLNFMDGAVALRQKVIPNQATPGADYGAVVLTGSRHDIRVEVQENGSSGLQLGTREHTCSLSKIDVLADGNGGYVAGGSPEFRRVGVRLVNYYGIGGRVVADDFRARYGWPRQQRGLEVVGNPRPFTAATTPRLTVGDYYRIKDVSGGADFRGAQGGYAAPSNAVGTVFQARLRGTVSGTPAVVWGAGALEPPNDKLALDLLVENQYDQDQGLGPGYSVDGDRGNSALVVNGVKVWPIDRRSR